MKQQSIEERLAKLTATGLPDRDCTTDMLTTGVRQNNKVESKTIEGLDFETKAPFVEHTYYSKGSSVAFGGSREDAGLNNDEKLILVCVIDLAIKKKSQQFTATRKELGKAFEKVGLIKKGDTHRTRDVNALLEMTTRLNKKSVYIFQGGDFYKITTVLTVKDRRHHVFTGKLEEATIELGSWIDVATYINLTPDIQEFSTLVTTLAKWVDVGITVYLVDLIKRHQYKFNADSKTPYISVTWENLANIAGLATSLKKNPTRTKDELLKECEKALKLQDHSMEKKGGYPYRVTGDKKAGIKVTKMEIQ